MGERDESDGKWMWIAIIAIFALLTFKDILDDLIHPPLPAPPQEGSAE